jgi:hypothetical protein
VQPLPIEVASVRSSDRARLHPSLHPSDRHHRSNARARRDSLGRGRITLLSFHRALVKRKYRLLFTPNKRGKPDPKGPSPELIAAIIEMKQRNRQFGCRRIAEQLSFVFEVDIDKDLVRRVLAKYYYPNPGGDGPSWLTFLGHSKDSLWNVDLVRCESLILKTHWVMLVMDQLTRRSSALPSTPAIRMAPRFVVSSTRSLTRRLRGPAASAVTTILCSSFIDGRQI